jgi:hypothetical protein
MRLQLDIFSLQEFAILFADFLVLRLRFSVPFGDVFQPGILGSNGKRMFDIDRSADCIGAELKILFSFWHSIKSIFENI